MSLLHELGIKYWTDKVYIHNFMQFYEQYFNSIRYEVKNLLEIGVADSSSIKVWLDYFPNAQIYGLDIERRPSVLSHERFSFILKDIMDPSLNDMFNKNFFDIVIDDGGHKMTQQFQSFKWFWPKLKSNGFFIMEDMHTSFMLCHMDFTPTTYEFFVDKVDHNDLEINNMRNEIKSIHIYNRNNLIGRDTSITGIFQK